MLASESLLARVSTQRREFVVGSVATLVVLIAIALTRLIESRSPAAVPTVARSVVVLPLESAASSNESEWISYGIAYELTTALGRIPGLRVAPTPSQLGRMRPAGSDLRELASRLNVGAVLHGAVQRTGRNIHVSLRLTSVDEDSTLWATELARDTFDLRDLENEIALAVANVLRVQVGLPQIPRAEKATRDPRAHVLVIRAAYLRERGDRSALHTAVALLEEAVRLDTVYARAWSDLAVLLATLSDSRTADVAADRRRAIEAARRAIALDSALAEPHVALARVHAARSDLTQAMREYVVAIRLDPRLASARFGYSRLLSREGRTDEALREARRAHELDPFDGDVHLNYAQMLERAGHHTDARREMAELRRITNYLTAHE